MPHALPGPAERKALEEEGARLLTRLARGENSAGRDTEALRFADRLRDLRAMEELGRFADRARTLAPDDVLLRVREAQALVDLGLPHAARDVLRACPPAGPADGLAWSELRGLLGRVSKQVFIDSLDRAAPSARAALGDAIAAYRDVFDRDRSHFWHGINLVALLRRPEAVGLDPAAGVAGAAAVARQVLAALEAVPEAERDIWWRPTFAEAQLGLGDADAFERALAALLDAFGGPGAGAAGFVVNALRRQLMEVWELDSPRGPLGPRGQAVLDLLRGALLRAPTLQSTVAVTAAAVAAPRPPAEASAALERNFGGVGVQTAQWWDLGRQRARSVAAVWGPDRAGTARRLGTGFLVSVLLKGEDHPVSCVLTNAHVVNDGSLDPCAIRDAREARLRFEGAATGRRTPEHRVAEVLWCSPVERHDAALLKLDPPVPATLPPLPASAALPRPGDGAQLYVIGHPLGDALSFSFQDNRLLDHDGPPSTTPRQAGVALLHYRTPTEPGSSGSPVFAEDRWRAVALHHAGTATMQPLNGKTGSYEANEGISLASIAAALLAEKGHRLLLDVAEA